MASVSIEEMRNFVSKVSSTESWKKRVKKMPDSQVFAIYKREMTKREQEQMDARAAKRRGEVPGQPPAEDDIPF